MTVSPAREQSREGDRFITDVKTPIMKTEGKQTRVKKFQLIEHTADIGLTAYGQSLAEAYANAAYGMFSIIADLRSVRETESRRLEISEDDPETLLFEWLNRLIYLFDVETILFKRFEVSEFNGNSLKATCYGEKYNPFRHRVKTGVKSATFHMLKVDPEKNQVQVIFDI
jgi:SHS2 domain-containing protein